MTLSASLSRRSVLQAALGSAAAITLASSPALAQKAYPNKPLRWVIAYPAGGGQDFLARNLAVQMGKQLGQSIVIDNRPGAAGIIGTDVAAKSPADGYTLVTGDNGAMVLNTALYKKLPYSPDDFTPLGFMAGFPLILVVNPNSPFTSARQWLDEVKKKPGVYSYASPGAGSPHHLAMELIKERSGSFIVHVPYRGTAMAIQDVISGQLPMMVVDTAGGLAQIRAGKVRALAVLSPKRIASLPDVPTLAESGLSKFEAVAWQGLYVPKGTPADIVERLSAEMQKAIVVPELKARLEEFGLEVTPSDGPHLARFVQNETKFWHKLIRERQLSLD
ncbi:Tripartite-type tricarboxylate transporter, receptor component TctC [Polaromonas sp. OV174]|uniref:Bug family tripartite tricarboxylate transporter substrate binding protein n=1 Tax=Polaromonas sp. OV174 TaxID=1855300 RepID=UPI0008E5F4CF|nr:tripartite tricarboxylate transporter substrate binding protein [Polaromonas sp. OV174]SFB79526.1 Tripartite-type tricarboxylate transporter, receptor component TctC [Polaromonas sp. OV174]